MTGQPIDLDGGMPNYLENYCNHRELDDTLME